MGLRARLAALGLALAAIAAAALAGLGLGAHPLTPAEILAAAGDPASDAAIIIRELRLPRTALAIAVGAALGAAGALLQGHTGNPVADPVLLGIGAGAGLGVAWAVFGLGIATIGGYVWFGLAGAALAAATVALIGRRAGAGAAGVTLVLGGVAVQAGFTAVTSAILVNDERALDAYRFWTVGSVAGRPWPVLAVAGPLIGLGLLLAAVNAPALNTLALGEDVAAGLGGRLRRDRLVGIAGITVLTGAAVAAAGPLGFVGLICAHLGRALAGADWRWATALAAAWGAALVPAADVLGRLVARPGEVPVGITLAIVGAPWFIHLVRRGARPGVRR